jgi:type II secretory pathway pseudopilin PulG
METILSGIVIALASAFVGHLFERRRTRAAQAAAAAAQHELAEAHRRSLDRPLLVLSNRRFNNALFPTDHPGQQFFIPAGTGNLLCFMCYEVDRKRPSSEPVRLVVENDGGDAHQVTVDLDGQPAAFETFETEDGYPLHAIAYPYVPELHGHPATLVLRFLSRDGFRDVHTYRTVHGVRSLVRVDP